MGWMHTETKIQVGWSSHEESLHSYTHVPKTVKEKVTEHKEDQQADGMTIATHYYDTGSH